MIPTKPPPSFREPDQWSPEFIDFVSRCLVKNPEERAQATELLQYDFIKNAKPAAILSQMIADAREIRESESYRRGDRNYVESDEDEVDSRTMVPNSGTLVPSKSDNTLVSQGHVINSESGTMVEVESNLGTMVINSDGEDEDSTMKRHNTAPTEKKEKYRPYFMDHFDRKEQDHRNSKPVMEKKIPNNPPVYVNVQPSQQLIGGIQDQGKFQRPFVDMNFDFLKFLSYEELQQRMANLDFEMEREIDELRRRYQAKRQPILDAMDKKKKRQQNF